MCKVSSYLVYWIRGNRSGWSNKWTNKQTGGQCKNYVHPSLVVDNVNMSVKVSQDTPVHHY